jgi:hypothetical protein
LEGFDQAVAELGSERGGLLEELPRLTLDEANSGRAAPSASRSPPVRKNWATGWVYRFGA